MKKSILFLFFSISCFSQTVLDREKIIATYDFKKIAQLKSDAETFYKSQKLLIEQYKKDHPFVESETKSLQFIDNGTPLFFTVTNQASAITIMANKLYLNGGLGLNLTGTGMTSGVWDGGLVRESHQELTGSKITYGGDVNPNISDHSTHVTGTIIARGVSPTRKGVAYNGKAITYSFADDYIEMLPFASEGYLVSNHSYGLIASGLTTPRFGAYDFLSVQMDELANAFPYYQIVIAAGNDRNNFALSQVINKGGYDLITGRGVSKNSIVVAAVEEVPNYFDNYSVIMSTFSNYGPTDDGRIKPDIAAQGVGVSSCTGLSDTSYATYQGTSMATPAITGMILLLQQHYNNLNPTNYMKAATVRGLICHSAREAGLYPGPDYEFGWGLANTEAAANIISNRNVSSVLEENTLLNIGTFTKQVSIATAQTLSVSIAWTDPVGIQNSSTDIDNRSPRLINNLDLKILKDGVTYYPWKLNAIDPLAEATNNSDNNVDNIEKIEILNATPGVYTIQVNHKGTLQGGSQEFSLIANGSTGISLNTSDYQYDNSIFVYPNPANTILNCQVKNDIIIDSVSVTDISGKQIFKSTNTIDNTIDVSNLSSGVYFITFTSENNSVTKKFIKQ